MIPRELIAYIPRIVRPSASSCGFALFIAANATIVLGGAFPFLPVEYQTTSNMFLYYLAESLTFGLAFFTAATFAYFKPRSMRTILFVASLSYFLGCCSAILVMYHPARPTWIFVTSGIFLGLGSAGFYVIWQRIFSTQDSDEGNHNLILGTGLGTVFYFILYIVPIAVTQLLVPIIMLPLFVLCVIISDRHCDFDQAMFQDRPLEQGHVYVNTAHDYWRSAVCIGAVGIASGVIRSIAITDASVGSSVNAAALIGAFLAALILLVLWRRNSIRLSVNHLFQLFFPLLLLGFMLMPFLGKR